MTLELQKALMLLREERMDGEKPREGFEDDVRVLDLALADELARSSAARATKWEVEP